MKKDCASDCDKATSCEVIVFSIAAFILIFGGIVAVDAAAPSHTERMIYLGSICFAFGLFTLSIMGTKNAYRKIKALEDRIAAMEGEKKQ